MPPMVSRMMVPITTKSHFSAASFCIWDEKSVAPRLKLVVSPMAIPSAFRPSSAPRKHFQAEFVVLVHGADLLGTLLFRQLGHAHLHLIRSKAAAKAYFSL